MKNYLSFNRSELNPVHLINAIFISIVLFLHHTSYANNYFSILGEYHILLLLQKFAVGGFFFFSGMKLIISNYNFTALDFFKKVFFKLYILYFTALVIGSFTMYPYANSNQFPTFANFLLHALCLQTILPNYFGQNYLAIWFVSILFVCYALFLIMRKDIDNIKKFIIKQCVIIFIISAIYVYTMGNEAQIFGQNFALYIMFFLFGMISTRLNIEKISMSIYCGIAIVGNALLLILYNNIYINTWYEYIFYLMLVLPSNLSLFYILCMKLKAMKFSESTNNLIRTYSFASYCIFLFHRPIWSFMAMVYPKGTIFQWFYMIIGGLPIIFIFSYSIQRSYTRIINPKTSKVYG